MLLVIGIISLIFTDVVQAFVPFVLGKAVDKLSGNQAITYTIYEIILALFIMQVVIAISRYMLRIFLSRAVINMEYSLRTDYFKKLEELDSDFYIENKTGDLMARATNDISSITSLFMDGVITFVDSVFMTIFILIVMFRTIDVKITLLSISPMLLIAVLTIIGAPMLQKRVFARNEQFGLVSEKAREFFSGIRIIKTYAKEDKMQGIFDRESSDLYKKNMSVAKIFGIMEPMIRSVSILTITLSIYIGGNAVFDELISLGSFVALINYIRRLVWPFMAIGFLVAVLQSGFASIRRINFVFDSVSVIKDDDDCIVPEKLSGNIRIENLSFNHSSKLIPTLKHIDFEVKSGQTVGIIGKTGSGKSTLVSVLLRLEDVPRGTVFFDDIDINDIELKTLRDNISYTMQSSTIFSDSIENNIYLKAKDESKDMYKYSRIAKFHDEVMAFKEDYKTHIGEKGVNLSGGQKQRLDIARALYKDAPIMIFDDSLSALDNKTQKAIVSSLKSELRGKTTIIISHRISTIEHADKIVVMNNGFVENIGTHKELIEKSGLYKDLYEIQSIEDEILSYEE